MTQNGSTTIIPKVMQMSRDNDNDADYEGEVEMPQDKKFDFAIKTSGNNFISSLFACCCMCPTQLSERYNAVILYWGKYEGTIVDPGCYCMNHCGLEMRYMSTQVRSIDLHDIKVLDKIGNPVIINGVVTLEGTSAKAATIDILNPWPDAVWGGHFEKKSYLESQAAAVLKTVASMFPYEGPPGTPSLQTEGKEISLELTRRLQAKTAKTGAKIISFDIVDLSYAPEIAQSMLVRQQATALVDARRTIVDAAVGMASDAVKQLEEMGLANDEKSKSHITSNLLTVICSSVAATPVVSTST